MKSNSQSKWWLTSKIVWLNLLGGVAALLYALEPIMPQLEPLLPRAVYGWVVVAVSVLTVLLRVYSVKPVRWQRRCDDQGVCVIEPVSATSNKTQREHAGPQSCEPSDDQLNGQHGS
ncbi:MAG: hypothetical protein VXW65_00370 [Pseudomonadota bacterium]|nr:hypothetical protein [Pseudomonadota bacterium]